MKRVQILRGPSGAGKTTWAMGRLITSKTYCVSADHFHIDERGVYTYDPSRAAEAHSWCYNKFLTGLMNNLSQIVVDNTNTHHWEFQNYVWAALMSGYAVDIIEFWPKTVEELKRIVGRNEHGTPRDIVVRMALDMEPMDLDLYPEGSPICVMSPETYQEDDS